VGQFAIQSALLLGAEKVIAIDRFDDRLELARQNHSNVEIINYEQVEDLTDILKSRTGGRGPDACIDAVGMESHAHGIGGLYDSAKQTVRLETDRPHALRQAIMACRPGGVISIPGVYMGFIDHLPMGVAFGKGLTFKMGQTHVHKYMRKLMPFVQEGKIDPSFIISHRLTLNDAPDAYASFNDKDDCLKVVLKP
jgi:threonine dehydrogenase-like Zn-dependent dehydrogenase